MSDNKLLAENTIRRFMKLANTETLTDNFIAENQTEEPKKVNLRKQVDDAAAAAKKAHGANAAQKGRENFAKSINEEEDLEENTEELEENTEELEENVEELEEQEEEEMEMDVELGDEDPMDAEPEMDAPEMDAEPEMGEADMSLTEEEAQLLISLGERLAAAIGGAGEEPAAEEPAMEEPAMEEPAMEEPEAEEEDEAAYRMDEESLVNEVLKRVTKRLVAEKLKNRK